MKSTYLIALVLLITSSSISLAQSCNLSDNLETQIKSIASSDTIITEEYFKVTSELYLYSYNDKELNLSDCEIYKNVNNELFHSKDSLDRLLAYRLIYIAGDISYYEELQLRLTSSSFTLNKTWIANTLIRTNQREYAASIFDYLVSCENKYFTNSLVTNFSVEEHTVFRSICWENIDSDDIERQIIAVRCLAQFEEDPDLQNIITMKLNEWDDEDKKWLIQAMLFQEMFLKPYLIKYRNHPVFGHVVLRALKASKHKEDNAYAKAIENEKSK
jgi:hypothetical protein